MMKKHLVAFVILATLCVAVAASPFAQERTPGDRSRALPGPQRTEERQSQLNRRRRPALLPAAQRTYLIDDADLRRVQIETIDRDDAEKPPKVRALKPIERGPVGRYAVEQADALTLLVDTVTGSTWVLCLAASGRPSDAVWLPMRRIDDKDEASLWKDHQEELKEEASKREQRKRR
jgi:hypothetical protein